MIPQWLRILQALEEQAKAAEQEYDCPIHGHDWCACGRAAADGALKC